PGSPARAPGQEVGEAGNKRPVHHLTSPSSRGPGPRLFTSLTRVRLPLGTPIVGYTHFGDDSERFFQVESRGSTSEARGTNQAREKVALLLAGSRFEQGFGLFREFQNIPRGVEVRRVALGIDVT